MRKKIALEACPFCGAMQDFSSLDFEIIGRNYSVHCQACGAAGPTSKDAIMAALYWNCREMPESASKSN